jgi:glutamate synthase (NADPH/NADH) large chain
VLASMAHRGATGADPETGDGAGILLQLPDRLLRDWCAAERVALPPRGRYGVVAAFLPRETGARANAERALERVASEEGLRPLAWRDVPVCDAALGADAHACEPAVRWLLVDGAGGATLRRRLAVVRRRANRAGAGLHVVSASPRTVVYKGLLRAEQLAGYYPDLRDPALASAIAIVHSRFSTNTLGAWHLAHPYSLLAHNGEINTVRGNVNWMAARSGSLACRALGGDLAKLLPLVDEGYSDSAALDAALELLVLGGRSLPHAVAMLMPEAWEGNLALADELRAFYEYHAALLEPWDGPAAIAFTDGQVAGAALDRNGLRPLRYAVTRDGLVAAASEAGAAGLDPRNVVRSSRLGPGSMLLVDTVRGRLLLDGELKHALARRRPYRRWLDEHRTTLDELPGAAPPPAPALERAHVAFGYTREELRLLIGPMAARGAEPDGSMGTDTPLAALAAGSRVTAHFKQLFAQVTNPAIDPIRERLVMSLRTWIGPAGNLLGEAPADCRRIVAPGPIFTAADVARLRAGAPAAGVRVETLEMLWPAASGPGGLPRALDALCDRAEEAVARGARILVLSDRAVDARSAPIPVLVATAAVHRRLVRAGVRSRAGLVVESGEPRETMDVALLVGYGAAAVSPYLALATARALAVDGTIDADPAAAERNLVAALEKGLLKVLSKMGISAVASYCGAELFETVGLGAELVERCFAGTASRLGGIGLPELAGDALARHAAAFAAAAPALAGGGEYQLRRGGLAHAWSPETIVPLQRAARTRSRAAYREFARAADAATAQGALRGLLALRPLGPPLPVDEVEAASSIAARFSTGAMSFGSISKEAHETLAVAMNRLGARSNTGEGGEDADRFRPDPDGDSRRSAIKQVASGRFGVTTEYLVHADELQIKIAQGAKPGEGGQLPGHKVDETIGRLRHSTPGVGLISPPPHHDIYSIEDLAQLIHDLRAVNPAAAVSVKLVAEAGVGTIAAGVAKADADVIVIAGHDGGTGASPLSSIKHAGLPWELGLAEAQQVLVRNRLRDRVRLEVDGGLKTGRDVVCAALLGAERYAFSTAPLVAAGCVMMRVCHLNTCPVGIATQDETLRARFTGRPEHLETYFLLVAEHVRELLAALGARSLAEVVGRADLLAHAAAAGRGAALDLTALLAGGRAGAVRFRSRPWRQPGGSLEERLLPAVAAALERGERVAIVDSVTTRDRAVGARISGEIARRARPLAAGTVMLRLTGSAGQSLGAFGAAGLDIAVVGEANDYVGKGLSGATLVVRPPDDAAYVPAASAVIGNTALYGATAGELFVRGRAGERFAVRNSGASSVVEGAGDHGCEYMTGGVVVVLGTVGRNFGAGMSGGVAFLHDPLGRAERVVNRETVSLEPLADPLDVALVRRLLERHVARTGSDVAGRLLRRFAVERPRFVKVMPDELRRVLAAEERAAPALAVVDA